MNISAGKGLQNVLKTNLGPKGTIKMYAAAFVSPCFCFRRVLTARLDCRLVSGAGAIKLTKDGKVLLDEMVRFVFRLFFLSFSCAHFALSSPLLHSKSLTRPLPSSLVPPRLRTTSLVTAPLPMCCSPVSCSNRYGVSAWVGGVSPSSFAVFVCVAAV